MTPENQALVDAYPQYYKDVSHLEVIDVYRIIDLYGVTDPTAQHSLKKLLLSGKRTGGKPVEKDLKEARDTLARGLAMRDEDLRKGLLNTTLAPKLAPTAGPSARNTMPAPFSAPAPQPVPFQCVEIDCTLPAAPSAIRCTKHCAPPAKVAKTIMDAIAQPVPPLPVAKKHAPWCQEKCAASACACVIGDKVPPAPAPIPKEVLFPQVPLAETQEAPYTPPVAPQTEPVPAPRGPVAAPPAAKL